jgi:hypothetical protein
MWGAGKMNDFTKEDLKQIECALFYSMEILDTRKETLINIRSKVLEMIDNYCDHDDDGRYHIHYQGEKTTKANKCKKCGELYE